MMTTYTATLSFALAEDNLSFEADMADATAPIVYIDPWDDERRDTPFRTADVQHSVMTAALMLMDWLGEDYWLDPDAETVVSEAGQIEEINGQPRDSYMRDLIVSVEAGD